MFRELTRKHLALSREECIRILREEKRGVLSVLGEDGYPYGMPMNHWYHEAEGALYFHCGRAGHRLDALGRSNKVSFCVYDGGERQEGQWFWHVRSVIVFGRMEIVDDWDEVIRVATALSRKFTDDEGYIAREIKAFAHETRLLKLTLDNITGKHVTES